MDPTPTTDNLLLQAAADPDRRSALLARAAGLARTVADWQGLAEAWADAGDANEAERCLQRALSLDDVGVWDHRRAAATRARLGDVAGAAATLTKLEQAWRASGATNGLDWRLLAEGFHESGDAEGARRCLAVGRERAQDVEDLYSIAKGFAELSGDRATAQASIERAEAIAAHALDWQGRPDTSAFVTLAIAWAEVLGDPVRAAAMLEAGLARADDTSGCLTVAGAWSVCEGGGAATAEPFLRAVQRARTFAVRFADRLAIAETLRDGAADEEALREALRQALERATTAAERDRVEVLRQDWSVTDETASPRPCGCTPDELAPPRVSSLGWPVDAGALFDWLRERVTESTLATIAAADVGWQIEKNLAALRRIWRDGRVCLPLAWEPHEVLSLRRWQEGAHVDHVERAFVCTVLCLAELGDDPTGSGGLEDTLAVLLESCVLLGESALQRLPGLLAALPERTGLRDHVEALFCALALLLAATRRDPGDARLEGLAARVLAMAEECEALGPAAHPEHGFVLGVTHFDQSVHVWQRLVQSTFSGAPAAPRGPAFTELGARLLGR